jgi:hypothetical protein
VPTLSGIGTYVNFSFATTTVLGNSGTITFTSNGAKESGQLQIIYNSSVFDIWSRVAIQINVGGTAYYLHHPDYVGDVTIQPTGQGYSVAAFNCRYVRKVATPTVQEELAGLASMGATLKFEWVKAPLPTTSAVSLDIFGCMPTGFVPFGNSFGLSVFDKGTRQESALTVCKSNLPPLLSRTGGTAIPGVRYGTIEGFTYTYILRGGSTPTGTDRYVLPWVDETGDGVYYMAMNIGGISNITTSAIGSYTVSKLDLYDDVAPYSLQASIPTGATNIFVNGRLFVANNKTGSNSGKYYFSQKEYPFRFSELVSSIDGVFDATSSGSGKFDTNVQAFAMMSGSSLGASPILMFT